MICIIPQQGEAWIF